jgi:hypothetical protein
MKADDVAREVNEVITAAVPGRNVHTMNGRDPSGHSEAEQIADDELIMLKKFLIVPAVR